MQIYVAKTKAEAMNLACRCLIFLFLLHPCVIKSSADSKCPKSFNCGNLGALEFPLADSVEPECGIFTVNCTSEPPRIQFGAGGVWYNILQKLSANKFRVRDTLLYDRLAGRSCFSFGNQSLYSPFSSFTISPDLTIFSCTNSLDPDGREKFQDYFQNYRNFTPCEAFTLYYKDPADGFPLGESSIPGGCRVVLMPLRPNQDSGDLFQMLTSDFDLEWDFSAECLSCHRKGRKCLVNTDGEILCQGKRTSKKILIILIHKFDEAMIMTGGVGLTALVATSILLFLFIRRKHTLLKLLGLPKAKLESEKDIEFFLQNHGNLAHKRYKYSDLKKMTNSFSDKLGGSYGSVYKGKLPDGRLVAVKILKESKGNGEEFINEVASISRTSHVNIVSLLGFCFEGPKRALIYEFMPNGSLEKFIGNPSSSTEHQLGLEKLFQIAVRVAQGLDYLHSGCNTRILHFDIKPHNILLDKDLKPKISDFGLAKLCPNRSSIVSILDARGTVGYIAPEVLCRNFGEVSDKSDVYSYGMLVLEMVAGKKKIDPRADDQSSEMYFSDWINKQLEVNSVMSLDSIENEDECQLARKMIIVGLWCIQTLPKNRPSISRVLEMLEGSLESLQIPPKPFLFSPPILAADASISEPSKSQLTLSYTNGGGQN